MNPQDKPGISYLSQEHGFSAFPDIALSSYTFSKLVVSAMVDAVVALNRTFLEGKLISCPLKLSVPSTPGT
jgi:hypothetical protein